MGVIHTRLFAIVSVFTILSKVNRLQTTEIGLSVSEVELDRNPGNGGDGVRGMYNFESLRPVHTE